MAKGMHDGYSRVSFEEIETALWAGIGNFKSRHSEASRTHIFSPEAVVSMEMKCSRLFGENITDDIQTKIHTALAEGIAAFQRNCPVMAERAGDLSAAFDFLAAEILSLLIQKKTLLNA
ncbi:MAG: hypothetical protein HY617_01480 [Candidatus Sungbacteria bacterium]|nr:hypothetical protein [Candidatus Sungbacteria bacterium]